MDWLCVLGASALEVLGVHYMNRWKQNNNPLFIPLLLCIFISSLYFLHLAMRTLPMSIVYASWTGIGAIGSVAMGILFYGESANKKRLCSIALIIISVILLKLLS